MQDVFIVPFRVSPSVNSIMPAGANGAVVSCYATGDRYETAVKKCLAALGRDGLNVDEILQPINVMAIADWATHAAEQWSDYSSTLPDQKKFEHLIAHDQVVYGPFGTF